MPTEQYVAVPFSGSFERDIENARVLIEESPWKENPQKYQKVAESIVRRVLNFDPSNEAAKRLLARLEAKNTDIKVQVAEPEPPLIPKPQSEPPPKKVVELAIPDPPRPRRPVAQPEFSFVIEPPVIEPKPPARPPWVLVALAAFGAIAGLTLLVTHRSTLTAQHSPK